MDSIRPPSEKTNGILRKLNRAISPSNRVSFYPIVAKKAHGCTITDVEGNDFLDFNASWTAAPLGYSNEEVINAIENEIREGVGLAGLSRHPSETTLKFAEKLIQITPGKHKKEVWLGHGASDACAAAYKLYPVATGKERVLSFFGGMYGTDWAGIAMSGHSMFAKFRTPSLVTKVPYAYCYRCPFGKEYPSCGMYCAGDYFEEQVFKYVNPPEDTSFMMVEAIEGDSGDIVPPDGYLAKLKETCDNHGILMVVDEAKIGMGRTGKMWAVEHSPSVIPDGVAMGKGLASGFPVGALVSKHGLMDSGFALSTLCGNAIGAAAGYTTIDVLERKRLPENAAKIGAYMLKRLYEMKEKHKLIGDVRGKGLFIGVELVKNKKTKESAPVETAKVVLRSWQMGLLLVYMGRDSNVVEITPPLILTEEDADRGLDIFEQALKAVETGKVSDASVRQYLGQYTR